MGIHSAYLSGPFQMGNAAENPNLYWTCKVIDERRTGS